MLLACLRDDSVVVDVGANLGYFTLLLATADCPARRVYAFEPEPGNAALLSANIAAHGVSDRVHAITAALGEQEGEGVLYLSDENLGDHPLFDAGDGRTRRCAVTVRNGAACLEAKVPRIDILKIDTQGTELQVLRGLRPLLIRSLPRLQILVELTPAALRRAGDSGRALVEFLDALTLPLAIVDHLEHRLVPESPEALARWCDNVDDTPGDEGFMNIFAGPLPVGI